MNNSVEQLRRYLVCFVNVKPNVVDMNRKSILLTYYSRSGDTEKIVGIVVGEFKKSGTVDIVVEEVEPEYNFNTCCGWCKAGYHSTFSHHSLPLSKQPQHDPSSFNHLILAGPIWAGKLNCPLLTWLNLVKIDNAKTSVSAIALCGKFGNENGFKNIETVIGRPLHSRMTVFTNTQLKKLNEEVIPVIINFVSDVLESSSPSSSSSSSSVLKDENQMSQSSSVEPISSDIALDYAPTQ